MELAYEMAKAYNDTKRQGEAVEKVKDKHPEADLSMLWAMWEAIDAYADLHDNHPKTHQPNTDSITIPGGK